MPTIRIVTQALTEPTTHMPKHGKHDAVAFDAEARRMFDWIGRSLVAILFSFALTAHAAEVPRESWLRPPSPEAASWSSAKLAAADAFARELDTDAYLVVDDGVLVHEYGDTSHATNVHSIRKSILSLLIGMQSDRGAIALDRTLAALDVNDRLALSDAEKRATVLHLLQARSGIYHPAAYETRAMAARRPARESHAPGTHFYYNNWDFNALATIFRKASGRTVFEAMRDDLAGPLQFENFSYDTDTRFHYEAQSEHPAYLMRLSARDLARVGVLVARNGAWGERRIVSEKWLAQSFQSYSDNARPGVGYGYLWWIGANGRHFRVDFPGRVVSARGHRGQYLVVDLARRIVVVHKVNTESDRTRSVSGRQFGELLRLIMDARS